MPVNVDVYHLIFQLLQDNSDTLALTSTCHALRHCRVRYVLQRTIHLNTTNKLVSFCSFMDRDPERRFGLVKKCLRFSEGITALDSPTTVETQLIAYILERATSLEEFEFYAAYPVARLQPVIFGALGNLCALKELTLYFHRAPLCEQFLLALPLGSLTKVALEGDANHFREENAMRYEPLAVLPASTKPSNKT